MWLQRLHKFSLQSVTGFQNNDSAFMPLWTLKANFDDTPMNTNNNISIWKRKLYKNIFILGCTFIFLLTYFYLFYVYVLTWQLPDWVFHMNLKCFQSYTLYIHLPPLLLIHYRNLSGIVKPTAASDWCLLHPFVNARHKQMVSDS